MKKYKKGVVLGKFMPLHLGHEYLITTAISQCEHVTVIVCTLPTEPINGTLRYQWMCNRFAKEIESGVVTVVHEDEAWIPQEPSDCHSPLVFYGTWAGTLRALAGEHIDALFTSEDYGDPVAKHIGEGCVHVKVDQPREVVPISGTECRKNPIKNWKYMNPDVRKHFAKRILIIGAESTGKSTLTHMLAQLFAEEGYKVAEIQEFAREYIDKVYDGDMDKLKFSDITHFGLSQLELVDSFQMEHDSQLIFSDTDAIVSTIFQKLYYGKVDEELMEASMNERWDLVLFTQTDVPWVDDGQRNLGHIRLGVNTMFREALEYRGIPYVEIAGGWQERFFQAANAVYSIIEGIHPSDVQRKVLMS